MQPSDRYSGPERRRTAPGNSVRQSEDEDYDLTANVVSDGFRPFASTDANAASTYTPPQPGPAPGQFSNHPLPNSSAAATPQKSLDDLSQPSGTSKSPRLHDSLTLQHDGLMSSRNGQSLSSSSSTQNGAHCCRGTTQPSHPYQLYPQRTYSNATSSTEPLSSVDIYSRPRGPTHPYAMYTQGTAPSEDPTQPSIPVGFNSMGNEYRRQLGPNGEEAGDLIGPLGHMEELPPYTRYPDEAFAAKPATEIGAAGPISTNVNVTRDMGLTAPSPAHPIPGAGGIGLATRNPEFSSTEDDLPSARHRFGSIRSVPSVESYHQVNGAARDYTEKPSQDKWQRSAKKKLWGVVPYWAICLLLSGIVIMGIVMGAVIGTIVRRQREPSPPKDK